MEGNGSSYFLGEGRLLEAFDQAQDPPADTQAPKKKRSKFSPIRRQEVACIRVKGACIKCHLGKIKVPTLQIRPKIIASFIRVYAVLW